MRRASVSTIERPRPAPLSAAPDPRANRFISDGSSAGGTPGPSSLTASDTPSRVLAHVVALRVEEEKPAEAVAAEAATPAEPELIKKGKKETEEGEEGEVAAAPEKEKKK